ncbi:hypothetical protein [Mycobacterium sp. E3305]|uniref:DUF7715 family protein n=1 Tax=Mycobacterium sp. E3305 TaxID=1834145 RepID=UPI000801294F|nr:hypothetical protein [Mycobacterium sp. E3305]OBG79100.1 hypothetical protein A5701_14455 [Mycobacterium sp. E3305]
MRLLTIHRPPADDPDDFCWAVPGEVAVGWPYVCGRPGCGCDRAATGLSTLRGSSAVIVADLDVDFDDLVEAACLGLADIEWPASDPGTYSVRRVASDLIAEAAEVAARYPVGTVLRPAFDRDHQQWTYRGGATVMPDMTNEMPPGTTILTPAEGQPVEIGYGFIAETGVDIIFVTVRDARHGSYAVALTPALAAHVANTIQGRCDNLARLRAAEQNGERHDQQ